ncbi:MAG: dockerin type I repeat-containing protein [Prevotella sp.]|nr:dockerin type I repeat-containing protein [Prevotella sp.]
MDIYRLICAFVTGTLLCQAYCVSGENDGSAVMETPVAFTNNIDHKISFNPYDVTSDQKVPVTITLVNNGFEPIESVDVTMGGETLSRNVSVMPQETTELKVDYTVDDSFDGTITYDVAANFKAGNSNSLKARRRAIANHTRRIQQGGTQVNVRQVDMTLKVLSKKTDDNGRTSIIAEVNNASLLPLADNLSVKVGLYASTVATEAVGNEVTVSSSDLYDATAEQKNKVKIVTLAVDQPDYSQTLFLRTTPVQNGETVKDVRPTNNVLPVTLPGKYKFLREDVNRDKKITIADATALVNIILGKDNDEPYQYDHEAADVNVNADTNINIADVKTLMNIILGKN